MNRNDAPSPGATLALLAPLAVLLAGVLYPLWRLLWRSVHSDAGVYCGLDNYRAYFDTPGLSASLWNTLALGVIVALSVTAVAYFLAYVLTHARVFGARACYLLALIPLSVPSMFFSIGMIYLFGRQGLLAEALGVGDIYGMGGVVFGEIVFITPHATLLLVTTLRGIDQRLYLAARTLGASPWLRFRTITLPQSMGGLLRSLLVSFILAVTDFGIPKILGGDYRVLATELYMQIVGMQNLGLGSGIGIVMLLPTLFAFLANLWVMWAYPSRGGAALAEPPVRHAPRDIPASVLAWAAALVPVGIIATVVYSSFVSFWPYDMSLTAEHYAFADGIYGIRPFFNSLLLAGTTAVLGTLLVFVGAYLLGRTGANRALATLYRALSFATLGIPGTVLGLAFVFAFNRGGAGWAWFYSSMFLLVFHCLTHFHAMGHLTAEAGLASLDPRYESAGMTLGVGRLTTVLRVVVPLRLPALLDVAFYFFINVMTTVSGVVFLFSPDNTPASVAMLHATDTGNLVEAAAMGSLILAATLCARAGQGLLARRWRPKS